MPAVSVWLILFPEFSFHKPSFRLICTLMNYLAHAYLSFGKPGLLVGNMVSDFVKGKKKFDYSPEIQSGISLHRSIDQFTDHHEATREAKEVFRPVYRLYSGAFVDVVYDHFLASDEDLFSEEGLTQFTQYVYSTLNQYESVLPEGFARIFPHMKKHNWLFHYRGRPGIEKSFGGLVHRAVYLEESHSAFQLFEDNYQLLQDCFRHFWPEVRSFAFEIFKSG